MKPYQTRFRKKYCITFFFSHKKNVIFRFQIFLFLHPFIPSNFAYLSFFCNKSLLFCLFSVFFQKVYCAWFAHSQIDGFPKQSLNTFFKGVSQKKILLLEIMRLVSTFFDYFLKREKNQSNFGGKEMSILWKKWEIWSCINHFFIQNIPEKNQRTICFSF